MKLWLGQVNHNTPYPFPRYDITYNNFRESIPKDVWLRFAAAAAGNRGLPV